MWGVECWGGLTPPRMPASPTTTCILVGGVNPPQSDQHNEHWGGLTPQEAFLKHQKRNLQFSGTTARNQHWGGLTPPRARNETSTGGG